jgi:hypothetical protein
LDALGCAAGFQVRENGFVGERRKHPGIRVAFFSELRFFLLEIEIFENQRLAGFFAQSDDLFGSVANRSVHLSICGIFKRERKRKWSQRIAKPIRFYDGEMVAIDIDGDDSSFSAGDGSGKLDVRTGKHIPAFGAFSESKSDRLAVVFMIWVLYESKLLSKLATSDRGSERFVAVGKTDLRKDQILAVFWNQGIGQPDSQREAPIVRQTGSAGLIAASFIFGAERKDFAATSILPIPLPLFLCSVAVFGQIELLAKKAPGSKTKRGRVRVLFPFQVSEPMSKDC